MYAYDAYGNQSTRTDYAFYVQPRDKADKPWDTGGDGIPDLLIVNADGNLQTASAARAASCTAAWAPRTPRTRRPRKRSCTRRTTGTTRPPERPR
ncbi:hypothetical protein ACR6C2_13525 [Streptomyces sp. INA 01156]